MTHIKSHGFYAGDSFERMIGFIAWDQRKEVCAVDSYESADGFRTMTHYES